MHRQSQTAESGFTLLEIMMVIVILSVTSMMVAPSFFSGSSRSLDDEAHRLVQTLRLAQDEATLSSQTLRITFRAHSYSFQNTNSAGEWQTFGQTPYQAHKLNDGIYIDHINPQPPLVESNASDNREPILGHLVLPPTGIRHIADITLAQADKPSLRIAFRPGPGGIHVLKTDE